MKLRKVKLSFCIALSVGTLYLLWPFINGLGCNFSFVAQSEHIKKIGKCKAGILTAFYEVSGVNASSYNRYLYGVDNDFIYLFRVNKEYVRSVTAPTNTSPLLYRDYHHALKFYSDDRFHVFKYKCVSKDKCYVLTDDAIENIYEVDFEGRRMGGVQ